MKKFIMTVAIILLLGLNQSSKAVILTFDDLNLYSYSDSMLEDITGGNVYQGFTWQNLAILDTNTFAIPSGFLNAAVSDPNVALNTHELDLTMKSATPFNLNGGYFTAGWNDQLQLMVYGSLNGASVLDMTYTLNTNNPIYIDFGGLTVDSVLFGSFGGVSAGYINSGTHFAMDNLDVTPVPEPSMMLLGLLGLGSGLARLRKKAA